MADAMTPQAQFRLEIVELKADTARIRGLQEIGIVVGHAITRICQDFGDPAR
jgi:hypothetical protein